MLPDELCKGSIFTSERDRDIPLEIPGIIAEAATLAKAFPVQLLDVVEKGRIFDHEVLCVNVLVEQAGAGLLLFEQNPQPVILDVVDAALDVLTSTREIGQVDVRSLLLGYGPQ